METALHLFLGDAWQSDFQRCDDISLGFFLWQLFALAFVVVVGVGAVAAAAADFIVVAVCTLRQSMGNVCVRH